MTQSNRLLIVDDEAIFRRTVVSALGGRGYEISEARNAVDAIAVLKAHPATGVVILDLHLGDHAGSAVLEHLNRHAGNCRVIVLTSHEEMLDARTALEDGVFRYLSKSDRSEALRFAVEQAFRDLEREALKRKTGLLLDIQRLINADAPLEETLNRVCAAVCVMTGAVTCHIRVYDFAGGDFRVMGFAGPEPLRHGLRSRTISGDLFSGRVMHDVQPEVIDDLRGNAEFAQFERQTAASRGAGSEVETLYWQKVRSAYLVPICTKVLGDRVDAVLNVSSDSPAFFSLEKQELVQEFVTQATLATTKTWLQGKRSEIQERYRRVGKMFGEMSDLHRAGKEIADIFDVVTRGIANLIDAEFVSIFLINEESGLLENVAGFCGQDYLSAAELARERYRSGESLTGMVHSTEQSVVQPATVDVLFAALEADRSFHDELSAARSTGIPSGKVEHYLGAPINVRGFARGVLRAINKKSSNYDSNKARRGDPSVLLDRGFSIDDMAAVEITATQLGLAIEAARLLSERDEHVEQMESIAAVGRIINQTLELSEVLRLTIEQMARVMRARIAMLFLKDDRDPSRIVLTASFGMPAIHASYLSGEGLTGRCYQTGIPSLVAVATKRDGKYDAAINDFLRSLGGEDTSIESLMVVPIIAKSSTLGVIKVVNRERGAFTERDFELFQTFAEYVAVAIDNARAYAHQNERLAIAERNAALSTLVRAVAHEINNTVGIIPSALESIRANLEEITPPVAQLLSLLDDVAVQARDFANGIAGFSSGRMGEKQELDLNVLIRESVVELGDVLSRYGGRLELSLSQTPINAAVFSMPFKQIVRNVVLNAFQALDSAHSGLVRVLSSASGDGFAQVTVEDNGCGIRPDDRERIFEADFTTKKDGNGLGLWLAKTQLEMLGGSIAVDSALHHGTRFTIRIPAAGRSN